MALDGARWIRWPWLQHLVRRLLHSSATGYPFLRFTISRRVAIGCIAFSPSSKSVCCSPVLMPHHPISHRRLRQSIQSSIVFKGSPKRVLTRIRWQAANKQEPRCNVWGPRTLKRKRASEIYSADTTALCPLWKARPLCRQLP